MILGRFLVAAALVCVAACTTLPDTSGYTEATVQLRQSASAAGAVLKSELARTAAGVESEDQRTRIAAAAVQFDQAWADTVESLAAMTRYAEAVQQLTAAGNNGSASAQQLAQSVTSLAGAVGFVPGAAVAGIATDTISMIYSAVANVRASRSLGRSLTAADPIIQDIGLRVTQQVNVARQMFAALVSQQRGGLDFTYGDVIGIERALRAAELEAVGRAVSGGPGASDVQADLVRLRDARGVLTPRFASYQAAAADLDARERAGLALFDATDAALQSWAAGHTRMVSAIRERRPVSFESLMAAGQEIRTLVARWRTL